jgi:hypothetical protein
MAHGVLLNRAFAGGKGEADYPDDRVWIADNL